MNININYSPKDLPDLIATIEAMQALGINPNVVIPQQAQPNAIQANGEKGQFELAFKEKFGPTRITSNMVAKLGLQGDKESMYSQLLEGMASGLIERTPTGFKGRVASSGDITGAKFEGELTDDCPED